MKPSRPNPRCALAIVGATVLWLVSSTASAEVVVGPVLDIIQVAYDFVSLAVLDDGSFALAGGFPFQVQTFSRQGSPLSKAFIPAPGGTYGGVGSLGDHYFASWQRLLPGHYPFMSTVAAFLDRSGAPLVKPFAWPNSEIEDYARYYRYGGGPDEAFLATMYHQDGVDWLQSPVWIPTLLVYGADARPLGHPAVIAKGGPDWSLFIDDMAVSGQGRMAIVSDQCPCSRRTSGCPVSQQRSPDAAPPAGCLTGLQIFSAAGHALSPLLTRGLLQPDTSAGSRFAALAMDPAGQILTLWGISTSAGEIGARLFDAEGMPTSPFLPLPGSGAGAFQLRAVGEGHFALVWVGGNPEGGESIFLSDYRSDAGFSASIELGEVNPPGETRERGPLFEVTESGHGIVAWATIDEAGFFHGYVRQVLFSR